MASSPTSHNTGLPGFSSVSFSPSLSLLTLLPKHCWFARQCRTQAWWWPQGFPSICPPRAAPVLTAHSSYSWIPLALVSPFSKSQARDSNAETTSYQNEHGSYPKKMPLVPSVFLRKCVMWSCICVRSLRLPSREKRRQNAWPWHFLSVCSWTSSLTTCLKVFLGQGNGMNK